MRITIRGTVQGVGFRPAVYRAASSVNARGTVRNEGPDVVIDTDRGDVLLDRLMSDLPPLAKVESVTKDDSIPAPAVDGFSITTSSAGRGGVGIPTDTAVCPRCLEDMRSGRREGYPFTTCTDCGPRFTLIKSMPYDRARTAMSAFPVCPECGREYSSPEDRRFHHQTVCCPSCGPRCRLVDRDGRQSDGDPISGFAERMKDGAIGVVKSWGGMHICALPENTVALREWYGRKQKPFAIMVRDMEAVRRYGHPTDAEIAHLESPHRPIVLVDKAGGNVTEALAPGLDNIGMFLPYTGIQHILFDRLDADALIMTSANIPGEPMILDDEAVRSLDADVYLLHDQEIVNRADDSVVRVVEGRTAFIRKSRGHIPSSIYCGMAGCAVALGAQENLTASVSADGRIHTTQHIGNGESIGVEEYLEHSVMSLAEMVGCEPQAVAVDLHPGYGNRRFGKRLAEEKGAELMEVQHHWAHAASLLTENGVEEAAVIAVDGTGHGDDGNAWGGEVLRASLDSYDRVAHLQYIPLLGSERALYDLRRLKYAVDRMNGTENDDFDDRSASVLDKLMHTSVGTSSLGRILDALSYALGVCRERTYDGEPAMKMEPLLARGRSVEGFEARTLNGEVQTAELFAGIAGCKKEDAAYSIVRNLIGEMVNSAKECAESEGLEHIGITGGVSYNQPICRMFSECVREAGKTPLFHDRVPNGDGGISVGQAAIALRRLRGPGR
jgi:hydrogenase maturation protein HypF